MKRGLALVGIAVIGIVAWIASGSKQGADRRSIAAPPPMAAAPAMGAAPPMVSPGATEPTASAGWAGPAIPSTPSSTEVAVPVDVIAPIATGTADAPPALSAGDGPVIRDPDAPRPMIIPIAGVPRTALRDMFNEVRGNRRHEAIDIMAPRGTPVIATDDGVVKKLFTSVPGGLTVYEFDPDQRFCYYYAHLDRYAAGLHEGQPLRRGEILGYVGTTGNAPKDAPHLHFALIRLDPDRRWWKGTYVDPYPMLARAR